MDETPKNISRIRVRKRLLGEEKFTTARKTLAKDDLKLREGVIVRVNVSLKIDFISSVPNFYLLKSSLCLWLFQDLRKFLKRDLCIHVSWNEVFNAWVCCMILSSEWLLEPFWFGFPLAAEEIPNNQLSNNFDMEISVFPKFTQRICCALLFQAISKLWIILFT